MYKFYFIFNIKCVRGYLTGVSSVCNTGHLIVSNTGHMTNENA